MKSNPEFQALATNHGNNGALSLVNLIRIAVKNQIDFGTKSLQLFIGDLRKRVDSETKKKVPMVYLSIRAYVSLIAVLRYPAVQTYLESEEFKRIPHNSHQEFVLTHNAFQKLAVKGNDLANAYGPLGVVITNRAELRLVQELNDTIAPDSKDFIPYTSYKVARAQIRSRDHEFNLIGVEKDRAAIPVLKRYADKITIWTRPIVKGQLASLETFAQQLQAALELAYSV